jgi:hypothetical protein
MTNFFPYFIQESGRYRDHNVPAEAKFNWNIPEIRDATILDQALRTIEFWSVVDIPRIIYDAQNMCDDEFIKVIDNGSEMYKKCALSRNTTINIQRIYAEHGYVDCMRLALADGRNCSESTCIAAVSCGYLECLKFAHAHITFELNVIINICDIAAQNGHVDCLHYLMNNSCTPTSRTLSAAASMGHLDCVRYLLYNRCDWDIAVCTAAATHISCLRYLYRYGLTWDASCATAAANNIQCLRYIYRHRCPWDVSCTARAATNLPCLKFLHMHGCPWDENTCINAANAGNIKCLIYAIVNGCPYNKSSLLLTE